MLLFAQFLYVASCFAVSLSFWQVAEVITRLSMIPLLQRPLEFGDQTTQQSDRLEDAWTAERIDLLESEHISLRQANRDEAAFKISMDALTETVYLKVA